jgi:hypothetical protein
MRGSGLLMICILQNSWEVCARQWNAVGWGSYHSRFNVTSMFLGLPKIRSTAYSRGLGPVCTRCNRRSDLQRDHHAQPNPFHGIVCYNGMEFLAESNVFIIVVAQTKFLQI